MTYKQFLKALGRQIAYYRHKKYGDASYNSVAHDAKMRGTDWEKIEKGESDFRIKTISKIAVALKVDIEELFVIDEAHKKDV